jgi:hypothetical protein
MALHPGPAGLTTVAAVPQRARTARLRIAVVSPPFLPLPPPGYAGTERVVTTLAVGLHDRGHDVTVFAPADSVLPCAVVPTLPRSAWTAGDPGDTTGYLQLTLARAWELADQFDIIHSHVDADGLLMARHCPTPVLSTLHGRLDIAGVADLIDALPEVPLVATAGLSRRGERRRMREVDGVLEVASRPPGPGRTLILGDLNAVAPGDAPVVARLPRWIRMLLRVDGGIRTEVTTRMLASGFSDAYRDLHPDQSGATVPSFAPAVRLDYALLGGRVAAALVGCDIGAGDPELLAAASDHLPLVLDLEVPIVR